MWRADTTIGQRLGLGFGAVLVLVPLLSGVFLYGQQRQNATLQRLTNQVAPRVDAASDIKMAYMRQSTAASSYVYSGEDRYLLAYDEANALAQDAIDRLDRLPKTQGGIELFNQVAPLATRHAEVASRAIALRKQANIPEAQRVVERELIPVREQLLEKVDAFAGLQSSLRDQAKLEADDVQAQTLLVSVAVAFLAFALGAVIALLISRSVSRPVRGLARASRALTDRNFGSAISIASKLDSARGSQPSRDEIGGLANAFVSMAQALLSWERRREARANLSATLASSIDVEQLSQKALREIVGFTDCQFGMVYTHEPETGLLRRTGAYALDGAPDVIKLGEGIPGEAAASRRTVTVRNIPVDMPFQVRFGFDQVPPRTVAAVPMVCEDKLVGTILVGSLHDLTDDGLDFIKTSAYHLGVSLQNALAHRQLGLLAEELQEKNALLVSQNEELQAQSEEIQTQNEELQAQSEEIQAQSEELAQQNSELEAQRAELTESNRELTALRQKAEAERNNLQTIIDSMPEGVAIFDSEGRIVATNKAAEELYHRPVPYREPVEAQAKQLQIYRPDGTLFSSWELPFSRSALEGVTLKGQEVIIKWPGGEERSLLCNSAPLCDQEGVLVGAVGIFQDISMLKEVERLKDEFLSVASHELKSPLTTIKGFARILEKQMQSSQLYEQSRVALQTIDSQADKIVWLVGQLLDMSRVRMGRLEIKPELVDLAELVTRQVDQARVKAEGRALITDIEGDIVGHCDAEYVEQVVNNLLDNAIKYSSDGSAVRVSLRQENEMGRLAVADQGIGIAEEDLPNLFQRYYRSKEAKSTSAKGMGIGLYITHAIVEAHGGRIWVDSETGKGSTFYVELPLGEPIIQESTQPSRPVD